MDSKVMKCTGGCCDGILKREHQLMAVNSYT